MSDNNLTGKRKKLLLFLFRKEKVNLRTIMTEVYEDRDAAKKTLKWFRKEGWVELDGFATFFITDKGRNKAKMVEKGVSGKSGSERRLDTF